ncbi:hypothetical protein HNP69_001537 [Chryseobacterium koreense]|nr:hypothetical protein [Chryseobacterium koreense]
MRRSRTITFMVSPLWCLVILLKNLTDKSSGIPFAEGKVEHVVD